MLVAVLIFLFFLWCIVSPFLPKEGTKKDVVIHNNIHIVNSPVNTSSHMTYGEYVKRQEQAEKAASEEPMFERYNNDRMRF